MVWELCLHMFVSHGMRMHRAELILDLGLSMPSPPALKGRGLDACNKNGCLMPGCLETNGCLDACNKKTEAWMPAQKMHAWMPDKKTDACKNTKKRI